MFDGVKRGVRKDCLQRIADNGGPAIEVGSGVKGILTNFQTHMRKSRRAGMPVKSEAHLTTGVGLVVTHAQVVAIG